jgi:hypothetical protein
MSRIHHQNMKVSGLLGLMILFGSLLAGAAWAGTYVWEDIRTPFKQTLRFSTAETATVQVTIPEAVLTASERVTIFFNIDPTRPRLRPYLLVNDNRAAFYFLGWSNGTVDIRSKHLVAGVNELRFGDQTATGDLIFIYELRYVKP